MTVLRLAVILTFVAIVTANQMLSCPAMAPCRCFETYQPDVSSATTDHWITTRVMDCSNQELHSLPDLTPVLGLGIKRLWLNENKIRTVGPDDFKPLKLQEIQLDSNLISHIDSNAFDHMKDSLKFLSLRGNYRINITAEGLNFLSGLTELVRLDLGWNNLPNGVLQAGIFSGFSFHSLEYLCLSGLKLVQVESGAMRGVESLLELELGSGNELDHFPAEFRKMKKLKKLLFHSVSTQVNLTKDSFKGLKTVEYLDLSYSNYMDYPGQALEPLSNLKVVKLSGNNISEVTADDFPGSYRLEELDLSGNPVIYKRGMFGRHTATINRIRITDYTLPSLPLETLQEMKNLRKLEFNDNPHLEVVGPEFFDGLRLDHIDLSYNRRLREISWEAINVMKPLHLSLIATNISDLSFLFLSPPCTFNFKILSLGESQLTCDCSLEEILNTGMVTGLIVGTCSFPDEKDVYRFTSKPSADDPLMTRLTNMCGHSETIYSCQSVVSTAPGISGLSWAAILLLASMIAEKLFQA